MLRQGCTNLALDRLCFLSYFFTFLIIEECDATIVTYILPHTLTQQLSPTFSLIQWHNNCHFYSPSHNDTIVTYILPRTMTQQLPLLFSLTQWHNCHLYSPSYNDTAIVTYIFPNTMTQQLSLIFSLTLNTIFRYQLVIYIYTWQLHSSSQHHDSPSINFGFTIKAP